MTKLPFALALFGSLVASRAALADGTIHSTLYAGDYLFQGQRVVADSGFYHLEMQGDGNLVLYAGPGTSSPKWATGTNEWCYGNWPFRSCVPGAAQYATLQSDGNFVVYFAQGTPGWASNSAGGAGASSSQLRVQQDGNLVEYRWTGSEEVVWWASNTAGAVLGSSIEPGTSITHIEDNVNFAGDDYRGEFSNDVMQCGQWCASSTWAPAGASCNAFTWVPAPISGYSSGVCWLKTGIPAASSYSGAISGYIRH